MNDRDCIGLLQWTLPQLGHRWAGYRRVRRQVCRRLAARIESLDLADAAAYRRRLEGDAAEWDALRDCLRVTISRFFRDHGVFEALADSVLPALGQALADRGERVLHAWSAGCASGEEPYSLSLLWAYAPRSHPPGLALSVLATDADANVLARAATACYRASSLREIPADWRQDAFTREGDRFCLRPALGSSVQFRRQDLSAELPDGPFQLILCRNLAFTYFGSALQQRIAAALAERLDAGGCLIVGAHERLPEGMPHFMAWPGTAGCYRRQAE